MIIQGTNGETSVLPSYGVPKESNTTTSQQALMTQKALTASLELIDVCDPIAKLLLKDYQIG